MVEKLLRRHIVNSQKVDNKNQNKIDQICTILFLMNFCPHKIEI